MAKVFIGGQKEIFEQLFSGIFEPGTGYGDSALADTFLLGMVIGSNLVDEVIETDDSYYRKVNDRMMKLIAALFCGITPKQANAVVNNVFKVNQEIGEAIQVAGALMDKITEFKERNEAN